MKVLNEQLLSSMLDYIKTYQISRGQSPSYRNIAKHFAISSLSVVSRYIETLSERGLLGKDEEGRIDVQPIFDASHITIAPVIGVVTCGKPILAQENVEGVYALPSDIFGSGELFMLRAEGDSMINAGINSGDILVIEKSSTAKNGQIVVALIDDSATVKTYYKKKDFIILHPENQMYEDIQTSEVSLLGIVKHCIHKL